MVEKVSIVKSCSLTCFSHSWSHLYQEIIAIVTIIIIVIVMIIVTAVTVLFSLYLYVYSCLYLIPCTIFILYCICWLGCIHSGSRCLYLYLYFHLCFYDICIFLVLYLLIRSYSERLPLDAERQCNAVTEWFTHSNWNSEAKKRICMHCICVCICICNPVTECFTHSNWSSKAKKNHLNILYSYLYLYLHSRDWVFHAQQLKF